MQKQSQLNLADQFFHPGKQKTRTAEFLGRMNIDTVKGVGMDFIGDIFN